MPDEQASYTFPAAIVVAAVAITLGFGPNCAALRLGSTDDQPNGEVEAPTSPREKLPVVVAPPPSCPDVDTSDDTRLLKVHQRWIHTRIGDCEDTAGALGVNFLRCMWWVYGDGTPDVFDIEPEERDGPLGYQGRSPPTPRGAR